jgi:hypothetical protein
LLLFLFHQGQLQAFVFIFGQSQLGAQLFVGFQQFLLLLNQVADQLFQFAKG